MNTENRKGECEACGKSPRVLTKIESGQRVCRTCLREIHGPKRSYEELTEIYRRYAELKGWSTDEEVVSDKVIAWQSQSLGAVGLAITFHERGIDNAKHLGYDVESKKNPQFVRNHPDYTVQRDAVDWARLVLRKKRKYVILDTETTGRGTKDEIIQLVVIDPEGNVLFNENIKPTKKKTIAPKAFKKHNLSISMLSNCPTFPQFAKPLKKAIGKRDIITYNAKFDMKMYKQTFNAAGGGFCPQGVWYCAMLTYAKFIGEWDDYHGHYKWHKLKDGDHTALGDCFATLKLIRTMASANKLKKWYEFWIGK